MKKELLNILITEARKNAFLRGLLIKAINYDLIGENEKRTLITRVLIDTCDYIDFINLLYDLAKLYKEADEEADNNNIITMLCKLYNKEI